MCFTLIFGLLYESLKIEPMVDRIYKFRAKTNQTVNWVVGSMSSKFITFFFSALVTSIRTMQGPHLITYVEKN